MEEIEILLKPIPYKESKIDKLFKLVIYVFTTSITVILLYRFIDAILVLNKYYFIIPDKESTIKLMFFHSILTVLAISILTIILFNVNNIVSLINKLDKKYVFNPKGIKKAALYTSITVSIIIILISSITFTEKIASIVLNDTIVDSDKLVITHAARHEAGHCLIREMLYPGAVSQVKILRQKEVTKLHKYFKIKRDDLPRAVTFSDGKSGKIRVKNEIENQIKVLLAGMGADELLSNGEIMLGSNGDLNEVKKLVIACVNNGLSKYGPIQWDMLTEVQKNTVYNEIVGSLYTETKSILAENEDKIKSLVDKLVNDTDMDLTGDEIRKALNLR